MNTSAKAGAIHSLNIEFPNQSSAIPNLEPKSKPIKIRANLWQKVLDLELLTTLTLDVIFFLSIIR